MNLVSLFQRHATPAVWTRLSQVPDLEKVLGAMVEKGRHSFPQIALQTEPFLTFLGHHLTPDATDEKYLTARHSHELYLVCAYGLGDRAASDVLESHYFPAVRTALFRLDAAEELVAGIRVHRATAARWIHSAQEELSQKTRAEFQRYIPISNDGVAHLMALVHSQLSLSLGDWLHKEVEPEKTT